MPDTKISAAADIVSVVATDMLPVARSGSTTAYHATMAEMATWANTNLPVASTTVLGASKIDGTTITIASGVISAPSPFGGTPAMDGTANPGAATTWSRGDHIHPSDTSRAPLASPVFSGTPSLPTGTTGVTQTAGNSTTALATTAFVATSFAPLASPTFTGTPSLPTGTTGVTQAAGNSSTALATTAFVAPSLQAAQDSSGRNLVQNGTFAVAQRGTGVISATVAAVTYTADRWYIVPNAAGDAVSGQITQHTDANRTAIGDEQATQFLSLGVTGGSGATNVCVCGQRMEDVRRLSNKTVTVSFWCSAATITRIGVSVGQSFGTGGSPSASVFPAGQIITVTGTWTRYSATFTLPSIAGMTLGTNNNSFTMLAFTLSNGGVASYPAVGAQSGTVNLWGVQLEIGTQATNLDAGGSPQQILAQCQRFASMVTVANRLTAAAAGGIFINSVYFPVTMRATPTFTVSTAGSSLNLASSTFFASGQSGGRFAITPNAAGDSYMLDQVYLLSADL